MIDAIHDNPLATTPPPPGRVVWLPRDRMLRYQWAKVVGAAFFLAIFGGWLFIQWSNPLMRTLAAGLLALTAWFTIKSIVTDFLRTRGREMSVGDGVLRIALPQENKDIRLADVAVGEWREETETSLGLWLLDAHGRTLAHVDRAFLADQAEARMFLAWLRQHSAARFDVRWGTA